MTIVEKINEAISSRPMNEAPNVTSHLVDLAISRNVWGVGDLLASDRDVAAYELALAVLAMAGINHEDWTLHAHCQQVERELLRVRPRSATRF